MKFGFLAFLVVCSGWANTIDFASSTSTPNSTGKPSVLASVDQSWATALSSPVPSSWITATGDADPSLGTAVTFTESFTLPTVFSDVVLNLGVYADDSANVFIDSTQLFSEDTKLGAHCASGPIGCTNGTEGIITNLNVTADVHSGVNTITFQDFQEVGGTPFGVDFDGSISYSASNTSTVPEPNSTLFLCAGLIGLVSLRAWTSARARQACAVR
jgi:hypothetical protein